MINWKNKEPGYYTTDGTLIWTWNQLKENRMIGFRCTKYGYTEDTHLQYARFWESGGGVLVFASSVTDIVSDAFKCACIKGVVLNEGLESLWNRAFCECYDLEFIIFPSTIQHIGRSAFRSCESLKEINIEAQISDIDGLTFAYAGQLESVRIKSPKLVRIEERAFERCTKMHTCIIDAPIRYLGSQAFELCKSLKNYNKIKTITHLDWSTFYDATIISEIIDTKCNNYCLKHNIIDEKAIRSATNARNLPNILNNY